MLTGLEASTVLIQSPDVVKVSKGGTVKFRCDLQSSNSNYTVEKYTAHWYHPENKSHVILSLFVNDQVYRSKGLSLRFQPSRDVVNNSYILTITDTQLSDSTVYICGIWGKLLGKGTRLNVTSADVPVLIQSPILQRVTKDHTARLQCTMSNTAVRDTDVHWYRELPGQDMEWILTHDIMNSTRRSPGFTDRFQSSRDTSNNSFILTITNVQPNDTAVYYCKVWGDISGNGTQLNVTISETQTDQVGKTTLVWIILGALLAVTAVIGGILITRYTLFGKKESPSLGAADNQNTTADYENISSIRDTERSGDHPADSTYMALQRRDQSIYSELKGNKQTADS
ncbi:uncharacterized protein [Heterodontus francisci]|uniref:uncharacterized protein isoform X2 n=1 Tax=Heterodontus francisci TaxID=7792 RepID=UPI00355B5FE6